MLKRAGRVAAGAIALGLGVADAAGQKLPENQGLDTVRLAEIRVIGSSAELARMAGAGTLLPRAALQPWRARTFEDLLRGVPGLTVREEEGLGLRPNIGVRGLNPTRSSKVLLLEDGVPLTFAPYGDNASYYHPPISRFERVEVLRGSGQILYGPQTVGGVINYITPSIPGDFSGTARVAGGTRSFLDVSARAGGRVGAVGALASFSRRQADGARANVSTTVDDLTLKSSLAVGAHALTGRVNLYRERSNQTYSGLTESEWAADPRQNPFQNDSMLLDHWSASVTHRSGVGPNVHLVTTLYASGVSRDWWRQSSNSSERPNDRSDPACGGMANLNTTCGNQGRLRDYHLIGLEPRARAEYRLLGLAAEVDAGVRFHAEHQQRTQANASAPLAREAGPSSNRNSGVVEDNVRINEAISAFVQQRLFAGAWTFSPGLRVEHIRYQRINRLAEPDVSGRTALTQLVPGVGLTTTPRPGVTLFTGIHRGFAPPRTEDVIDNATGGTIDLDPELSWNAEAGVRVHARGLNLELTAFRLDFQNQIVPASVAGGTGAVLTNAGRTLHQGIEFGGRFDIDRIVHNRAGLFTDLTVTWLPTARFEGTRYAYIGTGGSDVAGKVYAAQNSSGSREVVSVTHRRLPYAPEYTYSAAVGYAHDDAFEGRLELQGVSRQFGDAANTTRTVGDGQQGILPGYRILNASLMYRVRPTGSTLFISLRNLTDALYIADRTRGLLPGAPRTLHVGLTQAF